MTGAALRGADVRQALRGETPVSPRFVCAWCPGFDPKDPANRNASHGMCSACEEKQARLLDAAEEAACPR